MPPTSAGHPLCSTLLQFRDALAARATEHALARGVAVPKERLRRELEACLDLLLVAVDLGIPSLFANHVTWTLPALHRAEVAYEIVEQELRALRQTLLEELPVDQLGAVAVFLIEATQRLRDAADRARQRGGRVERLAPPPTAAFARPAGALSLAAG
jgi:hypothetical protein